MTESDKCLTVYKASAGSGKTYTLAKKYITLLLSQNRPEPTGAAGVSHLTLNLNRENHNKLRDDFRHRHILAITFTRKATEEMKRRILEELAMLGDHSLPRHEIVDGKEKVIESDYAPDLMKELHCTREELADAATLALQQILFDYQNFNVSTIDAFFQRVLHTFARELNRPSDYEVELDDKEAMRVAVADMLDEFNSTHQPNISLQQWLYDFMSAKVEDGQKANFFNRRSSVHTTLVDLMSKISMESFKVYAKSMEEYLKTGNIDKFSLAVSAVEPAVKKKLQEAAERLFSPAVDLNLEDCKKSSVVRRLIETFREGKLPAKLADDLGNAGVQEVIGGNGAKIFKKNCGTDTQAQAVTEFMRFADEQCSLLLALKPLKDSVAQLGLLSHAWSFLKKYTQEGNTLLLSDTNELLQRIIGKDDTPFVYERMGVSLRHFLIDEFQDTSRMQWDNLLPLVETGLSNGDDSLVIGDEKQSIYRFRNSDSTILHTGLKEKLGSHIDEHGNDPKENTNYRSAADVVRFNNTLFQRIAADTGAEGFDNVVQGIKHTDRKGYVRLFPVNFNARTNADAADGAEEMKPDVKVMHQMAEEIMRQHDEGGYMWSDIAIIVNTNSEAKKVVNFLLSNYPGIDVQSDEALMLSASTAVQLIVSIMRIIDQQPVARHESGEGRRMSASEAMVAISRFEYFLNQAERQEVKEEITGNPDVWALEQALKKTDGDSPLADTIKDLHEAKPSSIVALVENIISQQFLPGQRAEQVLYLTAFQDAVIEFSKRQKGSLHAFLDWWDNTVNKMTVGGDAESDKVKVMTIHKSKGLQFKCVHIPFCNWTQHGKFAAQVWVKWPDIEGFDPAICPPALFIKLDKTCEMEKSPFHSEWEEEHRKALSDCMNKTYVAFTRAEYELLVWYDCNTETGTAPSDSIGNAIIQALQARPQEESPLTMQLEQCMSADEPGNFILGAPTNKVQKGVDEEGTASDDSLQVEYPVNSRKDLKDRLSLCDVLELDSNIDDNSANTERDYDECDTEDARQQGIVMHDIMSRMRTSHDLEAALAHVKSFRDLTDEDVRYYEKVVNDFLSIQSPEIQRWFSNFSKLRIEQPIYSPGEKDNVHRPDRVVIYSDGSVDVIDYKFTDDAAKLGLKKYRNQVNEYMKLLREMGYSEVHGYLCYPLLLEIIEVKCEESE